MKKAYIKPSMACANIMSEAIICLSTDPDTTITSANKAEFEMYGREEENLGPWDSAW